MRAGLGMRGSRSRAPEPGVRDARLAHLPAARCSGSPSPWGFLVSQGSRGRERTPGPRAPGALSTRQVFFKSFEAHWEQRPGARERQCDLTEAGTVRKVPRRPLRPPRPRTRVPLPLPHPHPPQCSVPTPSPGSSRLAPLLPSSGLGGAGAAGLPAVGLAWSGRGGGGTVRRRRTPVRLWRATPFLRLLVSCWGSTLRYCASGPDTPLGLTGTCHRRGHLHGNRSKSVSPESVCSPGSAVDPPWAGWGTCLFGL